SITTVIDSRHQHFHRRADVDYFLAWRGDEVVGRIAAIVNHRHNEFHGEKTGFFGFFECIDDGDVARALLETAEAWLRERGMERRSEERRVGKQWRVRGSWHGQ